MFDCHAAPHTKALVRAGPGRPRAQKSRSTDDIPSPAVWPHSLTIRRRFLWLDREEPTMLGSIYSRVRWSALVVAPIARRSGLELHECSQQNSGSWRGTIQSA